MHRLAEEWDRKHRNLVAHHVVEDGKFIPINRPCDWCGQVVQKGWIHPSCGRNEARHVLDLLYG